MSDNKDRDPMIEEALIYVQNGRDFPVVRLRYPMPPVAPPKQSPRVAPPKQSLPKRPPFKQSPPPKSK